MKYYFLCLIALLLNSNAFSQDNYWVSTQLPGPLPIYYQYAVGETCLIFAEDDSQAVHAFDINQGDWQTLLVPTQLDWIDAAADGNVAMIYNDSIVAAYSAITNTFSAIKYSGTRVSLSLTIGCIDNFAYFLTDQLFYIFDGEDGQWHSYSYTPPGTTPWGGGVYGKEDYIYMSLWVTSNSSLHTMVAYSLHTKTFDELTDSNIESFSRLDHGFTFNTSVNADPTYLCGGYSAYTGQFQTKTHSRKIYEVDPGVFEEMVTPLICELFITNQQISGNDYMYYVWVFNTVIGDFAEYSFEYTYNGTDYVPVKDVCGGQTAFIIINNVAEGGKLECLLYSALTHSFTLFNTPLFNWGLMSFNAGGLMIDGYDEHSYFLYDVQTQTTYTHSAEWSEGFQPGVRARGLANYWSVFAYVDQFIDTTHVYYYERSDASLSSFKIVGKASTSTYRGSEYYGLLITESGILTSAFLYSPSSNNWTEKDFTSSSFRGSDGNYFYINYTDINQTYFYDGQTNQEHWFPSPQLASHVLPRDSLFFMYSSDGKYIGYSMHEHSSVEYSTERYPGQQWNNFIVLNTSDYEYLLYDAYNNIFAPLSLTEEEGRRMTSWPGGKTALIATQNGYLFAYKPGEVTSVDENRNGISSFPHKLYQNQPNPFKSNTKIKFSISPFVLPHAKSDVNLTLKVYDFLGKEVATLVNEQKRAGDYEIEFNGEGLPSGVYFYTLKVGDFVVTQKMTLIK